MAAWCICGHQTNAHGETDGCRLCGCGLFTEDHPYRTTWHEYTIPKPMYWEGPYPDLTRTCLFCGRPRTEHRLMSINPTPEEVMG